MYPSKAFVIFYYSVFLTSSTSFWFFLRVFISLLNLPIWSCLLSTFSIRALSILVIVVLFLVWSFQHPCYIWVWFWCLFSHFKLCILLKARCVVYWIKETKINIPLMWGFVIILMGVMLCLPFALGVFKAKISSGVFVLSPLLSLDLPKQLKKIMSEICCSFNCSPLVSCRGSVDVIRGEGKFSIVLLFGLSFSEPLPLGYYLHKCISAPRLPTLMR